MHRNQNCNRYKYMDHLSAYEYLMEHEVKPSVQRLAVMDYLLVHHTHPTADEIYSALIQKIPTLSKTTVYNTLKLFVEHGAVKMLTIDEKNAMFDADTSNHAHFLCTRCNRVYDMVLNAVKLHKCVVIPEGFDVEDVAVYVRGICKACKAS